MKNYVLSWLLVLSFVTGCFAANAVYPQLSYGAALPQSVAIFETSLASPITSSATSMTLTANSIRGGGALSGYNCFTVDEGSAQAETICGTVSSTAVSSLTRGVSQSTGTTTVSTLKYAHRRGANVKITDFPVLQIIKAQANGEDTFPNILHYASHPTFVATTDIIDKKYVDDIAFSGASAIAATESSTGFVELGTALEGASSTVTGSVGPLVMQSRYATDTPQYGCAGGFTSIAGAGCAVIADLTGHIKNAWNAITSIAASVAVPLSLNSVSYVFPSSQGTATTTLTNNGSGTLSWASPNGVLLASSTLSGISATTTFPYFPKLRVEVYVQGFGGNDTPLMAFNGDYTAKYGAQFNYPTGGTSVLNYSDNAKTSLYLLPDNNGTTTSQYYVIDINNSNGFQKLINSRAVVQSNTTANGPTVFTDTGVWNNTTTPITQLSVWAASAMATGGYIKVYGSN